MRYALRENIQIDTFSDGEAVVYDQEKEMIHVLNITAALVLKTLIETDEDPLGTFIQNILNNDPDVSEAVLEKDFRNIVNSFIDAELITVW